MKIYAKQVPPEYQESPLEWNDWPENVAVFGNRHYNAHTFDALEIVRNAMNDGYFPAPIVGELAPWADWWDRVDALDNGDEKPLLCEGLELLTGRKYRYGTIHGCSQGDWQEIIYPAEYGRNWFDAFETEYFNTGTEWTVDPDGDCFSVYVISWSDDGIRREIADACGCNADDVVLLRFIGWRKTPEYEEVLA